MQSVTSNMIVLFLCALSTLLSSTSAHLFQPRKAGVAPASAGAPPPVQLQNLTPQQSGFNFNLTAKLPSASAKLKTLKAVPSVCSANIGTGDKVECKATMTATEVTFDDCGDAWTICRCSDAEMDMGTIIERFSRVPVGLRRYVGTVFVMSDESPHAYSLTTGDLHFFNDCQMETWIHEATHAFDYASGAPVSGTEEWLDAIGNDTCAPDNYALNNRIEDFAQVSVLKVYELAHDGELPDGFASDCMRRQLEFMDSLPLYDADTLFGNTCDIHVDFKFDFNLGAKKTAAPADPVTDRIFPLPGQDSPVLTGSSDDSESDDTATPTGMVTSLINVAPAPTASAKKKTVYDNGARGSVPQLGLGYVVGLVGISVWGLL